MKSLDKAYETLILEQLSPGVVVATLNRPERFNAMTNTMFGELEAMALALNEEDDCRVVILTGAGKASALATISLMLTNLPASALWACSTSRSAPPGPCSPSGPCGSLSSRRSTGRRPAVAWRSH